MASVGNTMYCIKTTSLDLHLGIDSGTTQQNDTKSPDRWVFVGSRTDGVPPYGSVPALNTRAAENVPTLYWSLSVSSTDTNASSSIFPHWATGGDIRIRVVIPRDPH